MLHRVWIAFVPAGTIVAAGGGREERWSDAGPGRREGWLCQRTAERPQILQNILARGELSGQALLHHADQCLTTDQRTVSWKKYTGHRRCQKAQGV